MDDEARNVQIVQGALAFKEASKIYKLPGHKSCATDFDLWKLQRNGRPMAELLWFLYSSAHSPVDSGCNAEIKITDSAAYINC
jgi:hypothetical protein